ncbi:hypothetical protein K438DRAFT_403562 [Mycena galopus ATCC 62051]|nr:hypothetical protein K438DRAFT_403562 [Mycena galopus ATCC 62051]
MAPKTGECHAQDKNSQAECDCSQYEENKQKKGRCSDCGHRRSHHKLDESMSSEDEDTSGPNVLDIVLGTIPPGSKVAAGKRQGNKGKIVSTLFGQANKEANKGMRPPASTSDKPKKDKVSVIELMKASLIHPIKGKAKSEADDNIFKALAIVVVPDGVIFENNTFHSVRAKVPDKEEVQRLVGQGLAVLNQKGFDFCRTWSHTELADFLYSVLPNVFGHFNDLETESPGSPQWLLGIQSRSNLKVSPNLRPTAFDVEYTLQSRTSFRQVQIFIRTYEYSLWLQVLTVF